MYLYYSNCNSNCTKHIANVSKQLFQFVHTTILEDLTCLCIIAGTQSIRIYTATVRYLVKSSVVPPVGRFINTAAFKLINSHKD
jgi:hypothetical protein